MRLDKYLSQATGLSRSQAQRMIRSARVQLNEVLVRDPKTKLEPGCRVGLDGVEVGPIGPRYFMLYKPQGVVCANHDEQHRTVFDLFDEPRLDSMHVAGRLDKDTTGLVLVTDDGAWSHRVTAPRHKAVKHYRVELHGSLDAEAEQALCEGLLLRGESRPTHPAELQKLDETCYRLAIHEGRYHQVKRMFAAVGQHVVFLHRERIGGIALDPTLAPGAYRPLHATEVAVFAAPDVAAD